MVKPRLLVFALALGTLLASAASAQYLEATIKLPDTLGPLNGPYHLAWDENPAHPRLYIGGEGDSGGVIVAEAVTCERLARISTGPVKALCFVPPHGKLYVANAGSDTIKVVDCATNHVTSTVRVASEVPVLQYNHLNDRMYCGGSSVSVIDCAADTVIHTVAAAAMVFAFDSTDNKMYAGCDGPSSVIDCTQDSVASVIPRVDSAGALYYNATAGKVYVVSGDTLFAVDTRGDTVASELRFVRLRPVLACDPERNRVYCADNRGNGYVEAIDCASDTVVLSMYTGATASHVVFDEARNRLLVAYESLSPVLDMYDAATGTLLTSVAVDGIPSSAGWSPGLDRLYCLPQLVVEPPYQSCLLSVVSCAGDSIAGIVPLTMYAGQVTLDTVHNRLYFVYPAVSLGCIGAVDCTRNVVTWYKNTGGASKAVCYNPNNDRLYWSVFDRVSGQAAVVVFDCAAGLVVKTIHIAGEVWTFRLHKAQNKLYVEGDGLHSCVVSVIDCEHDTVVTCLPLSTDRYPRRTLLVPEDDRYWYLGTRNVVVIDCIRDTVIADVPDTLGSVDDACACPEDRKIYTGWGGRPTWVVDMDNPARLETLLTVDAGMRFFNVPGLHKVYWFANDPDRLQATFRVIDSRTNTITAAFRVDNHVSGMCLDHTGDYVYCACSVDSLVLVMDTRIDSIVATVRLPTWPSVREPLTASRLTNRIYVAQFGSQYGNGIPVVRDSMLIGVEDPASVEHVPGVGPTVVSRGARMRVLVTSELWDAAGRRAAVLDVGSNDISHLAPGVYFVRGPKTEDGRPGAAVRKVVVTR